MRFYAPQVLYYKHIFDAKPRGKQRNWAAFAQFAQFSTRFYQQVRAVDDELCNF